MSVRLAEVHTSLADMEAESGPARAAALLAGGFSICLMEPLQQFDRNQALDSARKPKASPQSPSLEVGGMFDRSLTLGRAVDVDTRSRMRLALARALFVKVR